MSSSIDGLVSGLSTSSLISSLMQVEAAPQTRLKTKVSAAQSVVTSYQAINVKLRTLKDAAADLGRLSTWRGVKPTVSSTAVTATASGGGSNGTGSVTFDVTRLARAQVSTTRLPAMADITDGDGKPVAPPVTSVGSFDITTGKPGATKTVTVTLGADKSLQAVSDAINAKGAGVRSTVLTAGNGDKILQLSSTKTGEANAYEITGLAFTTLDIDNNPVAIVNPITGNSAAIGDDAVPITARDAQIDVHTAGGYSLTSSTNTFTTLMPGVSVTAVKEELGVTLDTSADVSGIAAKIQALVDAANATLSEVSTQTAYDPATKKGAALSGDYAARQISSSLLSAVSRGLGKLNAEDPDAVEFGSLSQLGIALDRSGQLTFKADQFMAKYNEDPQRIQQAGVAFADAVGELTTTQTRNVTAAINGRKTLIDSMNDQIENWGVRLTARQGALQKQYATLEVSLSKLKSQSTWLSGQIASLG